MTHNNQIVFLGFFCLCSFYEQGCDLSYAVCMGIVISVPPRYRKMSRTSTGIRTHEIRWYVVIGISGRRYDVELIVEEYCQ